MVLQAALWSRQVPQHRRCLPTGVDMQAKHNAADVSALLSPGLQDAPMMDLMCLQFVPTLAALQGDMFNERRVINGLLALSGQDAHDPAPHQVDQTHPNFSG